MIKFRQHTTAFTYINFDFSKIICICSSECEISLCMLEEISLLTFPAPSKPRLIKMPFNSFLGAGAN